jgi:hypothetical protein
MNASPESGRQTIPHQGDSVAPDHTTVEILSDADADLRLGLRVPYGRRLREYTAVVDAGARVTWLHQLRTPGGGA